jgi:O-antigen/teichoic acid export membrane protein
MDHSAKHESVSTGAGSRFGIHMLWCIAGIAAFSLGQWLLLVIIARLGGVVMLGQYAFCQAIALPVMTISRMGLRPIIATDVERRFAPADVLTFAMLCALTGLTLLMLLGGLTQTVGASPALLMLLAVTMAWEGVGDVFHGMLDRRERFATAAKLVAVRSLASTAAFAGVMAWDGSLVTAAAARAVVIGLLVVAVDLRVTLHDADHDVPRLRPRWNPTTLAALARHALPAALTSGTLTVENSIPRWLVGGFVGASGLGTFAAVSQLSQSAQLLQAAFLQASLRGFSGPAGAADSRSVWVRCARLVPLTAGVGVLYLLGTLALGEPLLTLLYGRAITGPDVLLLVGCLALADTARFSGLPALAAIRGLRRWWPMFWIRLAGTAVMACLALWLVPVRGLMGVASATVGAAATTTVLSYLVLWRLAPGSGWSREVVAPTATLDHNPAAEHGRSWAA